MPWADMAASTCRLGVSTFDHTPTAAVSVVVVSSGATHPIAAIFDSASVRVDPETQVPVVSDAPEIHVCVADLPFTLNNQLHRITVGAQVFMITEVERDGVAGARVVLRRA